MNASVKSPEKSGKECIKSLSPTSPFCMLNSRQVLLTQVTMKWQKSSTIYTFTYRHIHTKNLINEQRNFFVVSLKLNVSYNHIQSISTARGDPLDSAAGMALLKEKCCIVPLKLFSVLFFPPKFNLKCMDEVNGFS